MTPTPIASKASQGAYFVKDRPLVILAGWLGCQKQHLRRYETLYEHLGFGVATRIAQPSFIVSSATNMLDPVAIVPFHLTRPKRIESIQDLAYETLCDVEASQCSIFIFHGFSNGGCFLWEEIRNVLDVAQTETSTRLRNLRHKLAGVIFDSCPAYMGPSGLEQAIRHCSWWERAHYLISKQFRNSSIGYASRSSQFWKQLRNDPWDTAQLYLYSQNDPLASSAELDELVTYRQGVFGKHIVFRYKWKSSPHCSHLLKHPEDYKMAVDAFVEQCLHQYRRDGIATLSRL